MASIEVCLDKINELAEFAGLTSVLLKEQTTKLEKSIQDLEKSAEKSNLLKLNADLENKLLDQIAESNKARSELVDLKFQTQKLVTEKENLQAMNIKLQKKHTEENLTHENELRNAETWFSLLVKKKNKEAEKIQLELDKVKQMYGETEKKRIAEAEVLKQDVKMGVRESNLAKERHIKNEKIIELGKEREANLNKEIFKLKEEKNAFSEWKIKEQNAVRKLVQTLKEDIRRTSSEKEKLEVDFAELTANYRNKTAILEQFESAQNELVYPELQPTDSQVQEMVRVFRDSSLENGDQVSEEYEENISYDTNAADEEHHYYEEEEEDEEIQFLMEMKMKRRMKKRMRNIMLF